MVSILSYQVDNASIVFKVLLSASLVSPASACFTDKLSPINTMEDHGRECHIIRRVRTSDCVSLVLSTESVISHAYRMNRAMLRYFRALLKAIRFPIGYFDAGSAAERDKLIHLK